MALVLPLFMLVVMGVLEGGLVVYRMTTMSHAVNEGARKAALTSTPDMATVQNAVRAAAEFVPAANVTVEVNGVSGNYAGRKFGDRIRVTATYDHQPITSMILGTGLIELRRQAEIMCEGEP